MLDFWSIVKQVTLKSKPRREEKRASKVKFLTNLTFDALKELLDPK